MSAPDDGRDGFREFIAELKSKADIVQYVGEAVSLRRAGRSFKGLCPFHSEKTPSFHVDPGRQTFHCFGCGKGGDLLTFVQEHERLPFHEAARRIAGRFGVPVPEWKPATAEERAREARRKEILEALLAAQVVFEEALYAQDPEGRAARRYLKGRGLDSGIARVFGLGYAPRDPGALERALVGKGVTPASLKEAGLLQLGRSGDARGAFRGRVTFPIRTASGRVVGFSARTLGDEEPKYLNSPESMVFHKGAGLYGIFEAVKSLRQGMPCLLVEGNLDVVSLHRAGFTGAVAPLGTALTEPQAELLESHTSRVTLMMDGDAAGHRAALRALPILLARRLELMVAVLPEGSDPDGLVRQEGADALRRVVESAVNPLEFALSEHGRGLDLREPRFRARLVDQLRPLVLATRNPVERESYVQLLGERLQVDPRVVTEALAQPARGRGAAPSGRRPSPAGPPSSSGATELPPAERMLLGAILAHPDLDATLRPLSQSLSAKVGGEERLWSPRGLALLQELRRLVEDVGSRAAESLDRVSDPDAREGLRALASDPGPGGLDAEQAAACLMRLHERWLEGRQRELRVQGEAAERRGDKAQALRLGQDSIEVGQEINRLKEIFQRIAPGTPLEAPDAQRRGV